MAEDLEAWDRPRTAAVVAEEEGREAGVLPSGLAQFQSMTVDRLRKRMRCRLAGAGSAVAGAAAAR